MARRSVRTWRRFGPVEAHRIEAELVRRGLAGCPRCGYPLVGRSHTRLAVLFPAGLRGVDLECRHCRCFHARVRHTPATLHLVRLRRLAAAVLRA